MIGINHYLRNLIVDIRQHYIFNIDQYDLFLCQEDIIKFRGKALRQKKKETRLRECTFESKYDNKLADFVRIPLRHLTKILHYLYTW